MAAMREVRRWGLVLVFGALTTFLAGAGGCGKDETEPVRRPASARKTRVVVNAACPIEGKAINAKSVPTELTRTYQGKRIGFCCAACPAAWDKLTDKEKAAKLPAAPALKPAPKPAPK